MPIRGKLAVALAALAIVASAAPSVQAAGIGGLARHSAATFKPLREGRNVLAPFAFIRFCASNPADCRPGGERKLAWSAEVKALVGGVNRRVNAAIRPVNDRREEWRVDVAAGDCEDFALTKRRALLEAGLPAAALRIAVAKTRAGEGHAVIVVKTDAGDFVLDNRHDRIVNWDRTDLRFIKITSAENPKLWRQL